MSNLINLEQRVRQIMYEYTGGHPERYQLQETMGTYLDELDRCEVTMHIEATFGIVLPTPDGDTTIQQFMDSITKAVMEDGPTDPPPTPF